jgi:hypothetical protein
LDNDFEIYAKHHIVLFYLTAIAGSQAKVPNTAFSCYSVWSAQLDSVEEQYGVDFFLDCMSSMSTLYIQIYEYIHMYIEHNSGAINVNASKPAVGSSSSRSKVKSKLAGKQNYMYYVYTRLF